MLGRVDPKTGAMKEYPLKTPQSRPHGLVADKAGNIWYTGIARNYIGKLDPKTGAVTEYPMPDPKARGPHTPIFDQKGMLLFTLQSGMVGRLNPATGEIKLADDAHRQYLSLRHPGQLEGRALVRRFPRQPRRQRRSGDDGDPGIHAAGSGRAPPAHRDHA